VQSIILLDTLHKYTKLTVVMDVGDNISATAIIALWMQAMHQLHHACIFQISMS